MRMESVSGSPFLTHCSFKPLFLLHACGLYCSGMTSVLHFTKASDEKHKAWFLDSNKGLEKMQETLAQLNVSAPNCTSDEMMTSLECHFPKCVNIYTRLEFPQSQALILPRHPPSKPWRRRLMFGSSLSVTVCATLCFWY